MKYKNSIAIIRTKKDSTVGCHAVFTANYKALNQNKFDYNGYLCEQFEILETVGGKVVIKTIFRLPHSCVELKNEIQISNVTEIEILTEHDL